MAKIDLPQDQSVICTPLVMQHEGGQRFIKVDDAWGGTRVAFASMSIGDADLVGYYDRERFLSVARIDFHRKEICKSRLGSRFAGWDSHKGITLARSTDGVIHLSANMHSSPLVYANAQSLASILKMRMSPMLGADEDLVTYPTFLGGGVRNDLFFMYRLGAAGDGEWLANRWTAGKWERIGPIFASHSKSGYVSAYPTAFVKSPNGVFHVGVVWRRNKNIESNFKVSYASTRDFVRWQDSTGKIWQGELDPEKMQTVDATGEDAGLVNNPKMVIDAAGRPNIIYSKYDEEGRIALFIAHEDHGEWNSDKIVSGNEKIMLLGGGSVKELPRFGATWENGFIHLTVIFYDQEPQAFSIDTDTRKISEVEPDTPHPIADPDDYPEYDEPVRVSVPTLDGDTMSPTNSRLEWVAQAPNRDQPRSCGTNGCMLRPTSLFFVFSH